MLEKANVIPRTETERPRNAVDSSIIGHLVQKMLSENKIKEIEPRQAVLVHEIVLVDKLRSKSQNSLRVFPLPEDQSSRYRMTVDLRPLNSLRFCGGTKSWVAQEDLISSSKSIGVGQAQVPAYQMVSNWSPEAKKFFGTLDFCEGFHNIRINEGLQRLMCFKHGGRTYSYTVLPQGWKLSPMYFTRAVSFALLKIVEGLSTSDKYHFERSQNEREVGNFQDDVLFCASTENDFNVLRSALIDGLRRFGFVINEAKSKGPCTTLQYCGLTLSDISIKPCPSRRPVTEVVLEVAANEFLKLRTRSELVHFLRSWAGVFQFASRHLGPEERLKLREIHSLIKDLLGGIPLESVDREYITSIIRQLGESYMYRLPFLFPSSGQCSVIVTDANRDGWASVILTLVKRNPELEQRYPMPFVFDSIVQELVKAVPELGGDEREWLLLPVRWDGGTWSKTESLRSSTWSLRVAQLGVLPLF
jgi:hypothetical protein